MAPEWWLLCSVPRHWLGVGVRVQEREAVTLWGPTLATVATHQLGTWKQQRIPKTERTLHSNVEST